MRELHIEWFSTSDGSGEQVRRVEHLVKATLCLSLFAGLLSEAADLQLPALTGNSAEIVSNGGVMPDDETILGGLAWAPNSPIPIEYGLTQTTTVAADDGLLYIIGGGLGLRPDVRSDQLLSYDPRSDTYSTLAPIPIPDGISAYGAAVAIGTYLYVFGGFSGISFPVYLQSLWIYDTINDAWITGRDMPAQRYGSAVGVVNGKIIIAGGGTTVVQTSTWIYDPGSDSYITVAEMPNGFLTYRIHGVGLSDRGDAGQFHALAGGPNGTGHFIYDVATDTWSMGPPIPFGITDPGVATLGSKIYVTGGVPPARGRLQIFNLDSNTWSQGPMMPAPVNNTSAAMTADGVIYNIGGSNGSEAIPFNQCIVVP